MKIFDYATESNGEVMIRFTDGSRYDMPAPEYRAIIRAAHQHLIGLGESQ